MYRSAASRLGPCRYAAHDGSFLASVAGADVVGSVSVSGLRRTTDHGLVVEDLGCLLAGRDGSAGGVTSCIRA
ncbi:hypothetical protein ACWDFL_34945 [Streptomyces bungoensis]